MKSTGVVRRIDGLGRVVLPKEIRKTLKLNSGDLLQIFIDKNQIIFEKYSPLSTFDKTTEAVIENLYQTAMIPVVITDKQTVVQATGDAKSLKGLKLSDEMVKTIEQKGSFIINFKDGGTAKKITELGDESEFLNQVIVPGLSAEKEPLGAIVMLDGNRDKELGLKEIDLLNFASKMLTAEVD